MSVEIEGDIEAFFRELESRADEDEYQRRAANNALDDVKIRCWMVSLNYGSVEEG